MDSETSSTQTAIIVVTDLKGSTELRSRLGEEAAEHLRREHDRMLIDAITERGGTVIKGLGDGILARFDGAGDAVAAAVAIQHAAFIYTRINADTPLAIRVGMSAGDVSLEDGDCFGTPVIEASRLCAEADGGQILAAELVRMLARGRGGHEFSTVGTLTLKGLAENVVVNEVLWEPPPDVTGVEEPEAVPALSIPLPVALQGGDRFPYAGRTAVKAALWAYWKDSTAGQREIVLLSGEPGMGKTRLAGEVARAAHNEGAAILFGRCDEDVDAAYRPIAEALRHLVEHVPGALLDAHAAECGMVLARLVPEFGRRTSNAEAGPAPVEDRAALFDAIVDLLARASACSPIVMVLDDLHWADQPSLLVLRHVARSSVPLALTIIGTYRDTDLSRSHPLSTVLADLRRERNVERISLEGLDTDEIAQLMTLSAGDEVGDRASELAAVIAAET